MVPKSVAMVLSAAIAAVIAGCTSAPVSTSTPTTAPSGSTLLPTAYGGCGPTQVTDGTSPPPSWALQGFNGWPGLHWAASASSNIVAILFAVELVAKGVRPDGGSNKILWVTQTPATQLTIVAHPAGASTPMVNINFPTNEEDQTPSYVNLPTPGCWSFQLSWGAVRTTSASLDLWVLPAGSVPGRTTGG